MRDLVGHARAVIPSRVDDEGPPTEEGPHKDIYVTPAPCARSLIPPRGIRDDRAAIASILTHVVAMPLTTTRIPSVWMTLIGVCGAMNSPSVTTSTT